MFTRVSSPSVAVPLPIELFELVERPEPAILTTVRADGSPSSSLMFFTVEDGALLLPTKRHRVKARHIERDPRVSVLVYDRTDIGRYVEIAGTAELTDHRAATLIYDLSEKYNGTRAHVGDDDLEDSRVVIRIVPIRVYSRP